LTVAGFTDLGPVANVSITGGLSGQFLQTDGAGGLGWATLSGNSIANSTSNVSIPVGGGNVNTSVGGVANVLVVTSIGANLNGSLSVTGNIGAGNLNTAGRVTATGNVSGGNLVTTGLVSATGNVTGSNLTTTGVLFANGNVTGGNLVTGGQVTASGNLIAGGLISATGNITTTANISGGNILGNGRNLNGINTFSTISVSGQSNVVADAINDTLTLAAGSGIAITTSAANDVVTISTVATDSIFATGGDMGTVNETVTVSEDLGSITSAATVDYDLGTLTTGGILTPSFLLLPSKTVLELSSLTPSPAGQFVYCSNESGGAVPAFSDGTNWRRVTDRAIVS
jgi:hypothetical protein